MHEHLIYGYDDEKEEFYFCDNYVHGKYARGIIHFDDLENANKSVAENRWIPPTVLSSPDDGLKMKKYWEIGVYQYAIKYLEYAGNMGINLEIRGFYALLEHKKIGLSARSQMTDVTPSLSERSIRPIVMVTNQRKGYFFTENFLLTSHFSALVFRREAVLPAL